MPKLEKQILAKGEKFEFSGNHHLPLSEKDTVWFLERGSVNLFAIERKDGRPEGLRTLLATFMAPTPLFAFPVSSEATHEVVAITEGDTLFFKLALESVNTSFEKEPDFINNWINTLATFHKKEIQTETSHYLEPPKSVSLEKNETLSLKRAISHSDKSKINWIEIEEGEVEFLGYPSLLLSKGPFPLTYNAWVKSPQKAVVSASEETKEWKKGISTYHNFLLGYFLSHRGREKVKEKRLSERRHEREELAVDASLKEMVTVLNPFKKGEMRFLPQPIFDACDLIGKALKMPFTRPEKFPETEDVTQLVAKIAEASKVRYRRVVLKGKWWKNDSGHLLAFYGPELKPVALIDKRAGHYTMIDPSTHTSKKVDKEIAKELDISAYTFYPCFSNTLKTGKELLSFSLRQNYKELRSIIVYSVIAAILALFPPFATKILMSEVLPEANYSLLGQVSIGLFIAAITTSVFLFFRSLTVVRLEGKSSYQLQSALWDRILKLPVSFFRRFSTGNLILRVFSTEQMRSLLSGQVTRALFSGIFSLFYLIAMGVYAPALTLISVGILLVGYLITFVCASLYARQKKEFYSRDAKINAFLVQVISSVGKLRTAGAEKNVFSQWAHEFAKFKKADLNSQHIYNFITFMNYLLPFTLYFAIFAYVIANHGAYSVALFIAFNTAFISFYIAMIDLSNMIIEITPIKPLWDRTKVILKEPLEEQIAAQKPGILTGEIHVDDLFFKYTDESEHYVLENITMRVNPKEFVAIVGPSGCGKSTLFRLLLGFEKPASGGIFYDNKDLSSLIIHDLRRQIGVVLQEEGVIAGSIFDNLTCGGSYTSAQIERALEISGFSEDVNSFPMGINTHLSIGGTTLSGGQKQRLLIARAILPSPKILLLDEATSALDNKNQEKVIKSIDQLDVTRIVIAHRLATIRNADRIYVMQKGCFIQMGTYAELAAQPGLFQNMLQRQSLL